MTDSYKIIQDAAELERFVEWLPDLLSYERFYISLFARKKYDPDIRSGDKTSLCRFACHKDDIVKKLRQLEVPHAAYIVRGNPVKQKSLVVYITPNPRSLKRAAYATARELISQLERDQENINPSATSLTQIHKAKSRNHCVTFDIDNPDPDKMHEVIHTVALSLGMECISVIQTHSGYHLMIDPLKVPLAAGQFWHKLVTRVAMPDQIGDLLSPIPGCVQGGKIPRMFIRKGRLQ